MLLTGLLGQVGHAWAHGAGSDPAGAWLAALQAEREWLASSAADPADTSVQVFGAEGRHSHGDGPTHQHDGPDGLLADHAHGVAFLLPAVSGLVHRTVGGSPAWTFSAGLVGAQSDHPDRPPRIDAALA
jgi:hypothetical protein